MSQQITGPRSLVVILQGCWKSRRLGFRLSTARRSISSTACSTLRRVHGAVAALVRGTAALGEPPHDSTEGNMVRDAETAQASPPTAPRQSSALVFEAPAARRSSGSRWRSSKTASRRLPCTPMSSQRLCKATALSMGMPRLRQAYVPQPVVNPFARGSARATSDGDSKLAVHARGANGLLSPLDEADSAGFMFEPTRAAGGVRLRGQPSAAVRRKLLGLDSPRSCCRRRRAWRRCSRGRATAPGRTIVRTGPTAFPRVLGVHLERLAPNAVMAGAARVLPGHSRARLEPHLLRD